MSRIRKIFQQKTRHPKINREIRVSAKPILWVSCFINSVGVLFYYIRYMAKSGDAYQAKQKMLKEMKTKISSLLGSSLSSITNQNSDSLSLETRSVDNKHTMTCA